MEKKILTLVNKNGNSTSAHLIIEDYPKPFIELQSETFNSKPIECERLYDGFQELHKKLDALNLKLLYAGFRYDVWPSGMALSMGHGVRAYIHKLGKPSTELVDIFEPIDDENAIVSFEEKQIYRHKWIDSLQELP